jgi:alpha-L-rhamnosidase
MMELAGLRCEYLVEPLGIDATQPRLSWRTETDERDWTQTAFEVEARDADTGARLWGSGRVESSESVLVSWGGKPLASRQRCRWRVRVWGPDSTTEPSAWSADATFELGLLDADDWVARFITPEADDGGVEGTQPSPHFRRTFPVDGEVARARLYITALGVYEAELNGHAVGDHVLAPGWSSYEHRLRYQTHDVTGLLKPGDNALGVVLAD